MQAVGVAATTGLMVGAAYGGLAITVILAGSVARRRTAARGISTTATTGGPAALGVPEVPPVALSSATRS